ncbi:hypothetical protein HRbin37_01227 [bacterium HR37]|jgi:hypothetical protein|nr:hypothetical protein HRbin37_01227 [bacterium HR37]
MKKIVTLLLIALFSLSVASSTYAAKKPHPTPTPTPPASVE